MIMTIPNTNKHLPNNQSVALSTKPIMQSLFDSIIQVTEDTIYGTYKEFFLQTTFEDDRLYIVYLYPLKKCDEDMLSKIAYLNQHSNSYYHYIADGMYICKVCFKVTGSLSKQDCNSILEETERTAYNGFLIASGRNN